MIHIVTAQNRHLYGAQLKAMRRERALPHSLTPGLDLVADEDGAVDDYDDSRAIYLLGFDNALTLEIGLRLRPTDDRSRLADMYPHLIAPGVAPIKAPDVWEASRLIATDVARRRGHRALSQRLFEVWAAAIELALAQGVTRLVGLIDMHRYPGVLDAPVDISLTGLPRFHGGSMIAGGEIHLSPSLQERVREALGRPAGIGYHVDTLDMMAFGDLAAVQWQVQRAMTPQMQAGAPRDETLAAETLYRLHDTPGRAGDRAGPRTLDA